VLLRSLGRIGSPKALEPVVAALTDSNAAISDAAVQVLANWPAVDAAPHLLKLAKAKNATRRDQGLRGYVRLAQAEQSADQKAEMLATAMKLTKRPEDKWLVLAAWGTFPAKQSLDTLLPYLKDAAVQNEAATAIIAVAAELGKKPEGKADAGAALQAVLDKCKDQAIRDRAQKTLAAIGT
jgi:HEAT repeat protein